MSLNTLFCLLQQKQQIVLRLVKQFYPQLEVLLFRIKFQQFYQLVAKLNVIEQQTVRSRLELHLDTTLTVRLRVTSM